MGKINPVSAKYFIHAEIEIKGVVDKPDVIGAIFGQTEGLLGSELELRELQKSGKIGRIEVELDTKAGKTSGTITIPSSLDKAETSIIGAALEVIERIGPCKSKVNVKKIEDVRVSKRKFVTDRAKSLLKNLMDDSMPDSQELADEVAYSVRMMEIVEYGKERLPAGPFVKDSDEIIVVEGRADVLNLLKYGFKNAIAMEGTNIPQTIIDLCREKVVTVFVDGDRGGDLITKELLGTTEIDFVTKAPDGKEVEELTKKEIHKAMRAKITSEQAEMDLKGVKADNKDSKDNRENRERSFSSRSSYSKTSKGSRPFSRRKQDSRGKPMSSRSRDSPARSSRKTVRKPTKDEKLKFKDLLEDLIGTKGAYVLDNDLNVLGKVPISELKSTLENLEEVSAVVLDGSIDSKLVMPAEKAGVDFIIGMENNMDKAKTHIYIATEEEIEK
ncbi:DNA primase [Candidatus Woesearchaeota archaeon]|nr:DNA primase [Candidatus Woesearchaeota archaeon]